MKKVIIHLVQEGDTFDSIVEKYQTTERDLLRLNPIIRNKYLYLGQVLYVLTEVTEEEIIVKPNVSTVPSTLNENNKFCNYHLIHHLIREDYISYINNYNDHLLIEDELFVEIIIFLKRSIPDNEDAQAIILSNLKEIHKKIHKFIDYLSQKNDEFILKIKSEIKENLSNLIIYLKANKIEFDEDKLVKIIENNLLMIAKLLVKNYYDAFKLNEDNTK